MSDGTQLNAASVAGGDIIVTETLPSGQKIQAVKLAHGLTDLAEGVSKSSPLPVSDNGTLKQLILVELRVISVLLARSFAVNDSLDKLRDGVLAEMRSGM